MSQHDEEKLEVLQEEEEEQQQQQFLNFKDRVLRLAVKNCLKNKMSQLSILNCPS